MGLKKRKPGDCAVNPNDEGSPRLVEQLDNALATRHPASLAFQKRLRELRTVCGDLKILPRSHVISISLLKTGEWPILSRGPCDVYEGDFNGSKVCVKRLRVYSNGEPEGAKNAFYQEAIVWKRLEHPNIVPLLGVTTAPLQLVSVWMPGGELLGYIERNPSIDRLSLVFDVVVGLSYLHSHGIIHGDLKGPSILVDDMDHARLTDFGLASVSPELGPPEPMTDDHAVRWAAPEILDREQPVSRRSDVYSLGMVVVEIFTGQVPFPDIRPTTVAVDVLSGNRPERPAHPNLTDDIWKLTEQCWNRDPQRRPDVSEVISRLGIPLAPQYHNDEIPDDTTLGSVPRWVPSPASGQTPGFCGLDRFWKSSKSSNVPRSAPAYGFESEDYEKSVDTGREPANPAGRKGRYLPRLEARPRRSCHNRHNSSPGKRRDGMPPT